MRVLALPKVNEGVMLRWVNPETGLVLEEHFVFGEERAQSVKVKRRTVENFINPHKDQQSDQESPKPRLRDYLAAELSLLAHGPVPLPVYSHRLNCCTGSPCKHLKSDDGGQYCGACGCGTRERARLKVKLHMPAAECPKGIWGKEDGEGILHLRRIGGIVAQVRAIIRNASNEFKKKKNKA